MGGPPEAPTSPDAEPAGRVRASDADRDEVAARLREEFAAGRLSHDTFLFRMDAAIQARHQSDLVPLLADLPQGAGAPAHGGLASGVPGGSGPGAAAPGASAPALPGSAPQTPGALAPGGAVGVAAPGRTNAAPGDPRAGVQSGLFGRLRAALPHRPDTTAWRADTSAPDAAAAAGAPGAQTPRPRRGLGRKLTSAMPRARSQERRPTPLQFPRAAGAQFSIGRDTGCDLAIADMTVSRMHARLERTPDGWLLTDLSSTNGTRVNGWRVRGQVRVRAGDVVSFGRAEYWLCPDGI